MTGFVHCVLSSEYRNDATCEQFVQRNQQLQHEIAALRREMEVLQTKAVGGRQQEGPVECCPCKSSDVPIRVLVDTTKNETTASPYWVVTTGDCVLEEDCLTSPNYPESYEHNDLCIVSILDEWFGTLDVQYFDVSNSDSLHVNEVQYSGSYAEATSVPLNGVVPVGSILWSTTDGAGAYGGFEICRTAPCVPGTSNSAGSSSDNPCSSCSQGEYTSIYGATVCDSCEAGHFTAEDGSSVCVPCASGRVAVSTGSSFCAECGYDDSLYFVCRVCAVGHFASDVNSSACRPCAPGQYSSWAGSTACSDRRYGYFANESGQTDCYGCHDEASPGGDFSWLWTTRRKELWDGEMAWYEVDGSDTIDECGCFFGCPVES